MHAEFAVCYTEKAREARQRPEPQYSTHANRKKQCRPNETKPVSNATGVLSLGVCENRVGWLVAWGFCV